MLNPNFDYFDEFSDWYENERHGRYEDMIEDLESDLVRRFALDADLLEVGCEGGLILRRVAPLAGHAVGVDLGSGRVQEARERGLQVVEADALALPFEDAGFDVVYSFKTLAHLPNSDRAVDEMVRVTRPGGYLLLEFYNPYSLRYLTERATKSADRLARKFNGTDFTRWDPPSELKKRFPKSVELVDFAGIRVVTPGAFIHDIPWIRQFVRKMEFAARDSRLKYFGGFLVAILRKKTAEG